MGFWGEPKARAKLRDWQVPHVEGLAELIEKNGAAADTSDTGTGKTYAAAGLAMLLKRRLFVIGPKTSAVKWLKVAVEMRAGFHFSGGWEECRSKNFPYNFFYNDRFIPGRRRVDWKLPPDVLLVFDEAHRAKGRGTLNSLMMAGAAGTPTLILSATLAVKASDMYASGKLIGLHHGDDFSHFVRDYENNQPALHARMYPEHARRLRSKDIPGFPVNNVIAELVSAKQADKLSAWRHEVMARAEELELEGKHSEAMVVRLRYRQAAELARLPGMLEKANDLYGEGCSVVMFFCFRESLFRAYEALGGKAVKIHGEMGRGEAAKAIDTFQDNKVPFILCTHGAGSESNSLHDLKGRRRASIISPPEKAIDLIQALGRIHRDGALSGATQYIPFLEGVEEEVYARVSQNMENIHTINDGGLL